MRNTKAGKSSDCLLGHALASFPVIANAVAAKQRVNGNQAQRLALVVERRKEKGDLTCGVAIE